MATEKPFSEKEKSILKRVDEAQSIAWTHALKIGEYGGPDEEYYMEISEALSEVKRIIEQH